MTPMWPGDFLRTAICVVAELCAMPHITYAVTYARYILVTYPSQTARAWGPTSTLGGDNPSLNFSRSRDGRCRPHRRPATARRPAAQRAARLAARPRRRLGNRRGPAAGTRRQAVGGARAGGRAGGPAGRRAGSERASGRLDGRRIGPARREARILFWGSARQLRGCVGEGVGGGLVDESL